MPVNFQEIYQKIKEIGQGARERQKTLDERRIQARDMLNTYASELDMLRSVVDTAKQTDPNTRCALPINESLASSYPPPDSAIDATLIAADGSQINPDRHAATQFSLINVGAIIMQTQSGTAPKVFTKSELLYGDELSTTTGTMTEGMVALRRDLEERSQLESFSKGITGAIVTFTDGPIELWGAKDGEDAKAYSDALNNYKSVLSRLQERTVITAGYVDKPAANLVVRLLELVKAQQEQAQTLRDYHPLRGVSDRWLYGETSNTVVTA